MAINKKQKAFLFFVNVDDVMALHPVERDTVQVRFLCRQSVATPNTTERSVVSIIVDD